MGGPDLYVHSGSPAHLFCVVSQFVIPPMSVTWTHGDMLLDKSRYSGLSQKVNTNISLPSNQSMSTILTTFSSSLAIPLVSESDRGEYSCRPHSFTPAVISLHVIHTGGEHRLPMLNSEPSVNKLEWWRMRIFLLIFLCFQFK